LTMTEFELSEFYMLQLAGRLQTKCKGAYTGRHKSLDKWVHWILQVRYEVSINQSMKGLQALVFHAKPLTG
jgi:hypothetical protein